MNARTPTASLVISTTLLALPSLAFDYFDTNLSVGARGSAVIELQQVLIARGHLASDNASGYFGPLTLSAVKAFQATQGVQPVSGFFGPLTRAKANALSQGSIAPSSNTGVSAQIATLLERVRQLQAQISALSKPSSVGITTTPNSTQMTQQTAQTESIASRLAILEQKRKAIWATTFDGWENLYDGTDYPADHVPSPLVWDNPVDDDWNEPRVVASSFAPNKPSPGFLTIDRKSNPADNRKTGGIWRRDEYLSQASGVTAEFRLKILPQSDDYGMMFEIILDTGAISFFVNKTFVVLGNIGVPPTEVRATAPIDGTAFHTYRMVWFPGTQNVEVYVDGSITPIVAGQAYPHPRIGDAPNMDHSLVVLGVNSYEYPGAFTLDYLKYRRGAIQSLSALTPVSPRTPPPLPSPASANESWSPRGFDGTKMPRALGYLNTFDPGWELKGDGTVEHNTLATDEIRFATIDPVPDLINKNGYTIEMRAKVLPDSHNRGFGLTQLDAMGAVTLILSPDKVETQLGFKPAGYQTVKMDTTNDFHTYRIVRPAHSLYSYVYIDNDPVPAIYDQHLSQDTEVHGFPVEPYMQFGTLHYTDRYIAAYKERSHVLIDYIRWHDGANAPPAAQTGTAADSGQSQATPSVQSLIDSTDLGIKYTGPGPYPQLYLTCSADGVNFNSGICTSNAAILGWDYVYDATSCVASTNPAGSAWSGGQPLSSHVTIETLSSPRAYTLTCSGPGGTTAHTVIVRPQ